MKKTVIGLTLLTLLTAGCGGNTEENALEKKASPSFMFWCYRKEIVSDSFHVPDLKTEAVGKYLQTRMKAVPGYVGSTYDLNTQTLTVEYQSSVVRRMNFEEAIALSGFSADNRPASPNAKIPEGVK